MATGHINAGYNNIVTRFNLALNNPTGEKNRLPINSEELNKIKERAKSVWSLKDTSPTTYGHYHRNHEHENILYRPSSPTRMNKPHPSHVFMTTRLRNVPGYFDHYAELNNSNLNTRSYSNFSEGSNAIDRPVSSKVKPATVNVYSNAHHYLDSLNPNEVQNEQSNLEKAGIDIKNMPRSALRHENILNHFSYNSPSSNDLQPEYLTNLAVKSRDVAGVNLQSNLTNPYLYEDTRLYKEKYSNNDHGLPNPVAKKPYRGDFMIHPEWHARLKHHRLPCNC